MSETWFSNNYGDLSIQGGVNSGFQFEFYCQRCQDAYRTPFEAYRKAQAAGWLSQASGLLGGILGSADGAANSLADAGWRSAWDEAFRKAVTDAGQHFKRCAQCHHHVCAKCFNVASGLCYDCAPDAEVVVQAAKAAGMAQGAAEVGTEAGYAKGKGIDVERERQLVCPNCGAEVHGAKFCPECGAKMSTKRFCTGCGAELADGAKFCGECGQAAGA